MVEMNEFACNSDYSHDIYAYPAINGEVKKLRVNSCSDRQELVPNHEIFLPIRQVLLDAGLTITERYEMFDYAKFFATFTIEDEHLAVGQGNDIVKPEVRIKHSYNGMVQYQISFGYFRLICENGLVIPVKGKEKLNYFMKGKHTASIKKSISDLQEKIEYFVAQKEVVMQGYNKLFDNWVANPNDRIKEVLNASGVVNYKENMTKAAETIASKKFDAISNIIKDEAHQLGESYIDANGQIRVNDWLIYNGINKYIHQVEESKKTPEQKFAYDEKIMDFMLSQQNTKRG